MAKLEEICPKRCPVCSQLWYISVESIGDLVSDTPTSLFGIPKFVVKNYIPFGDPKNKRCHGFDPISANMVYCHGCNGNLIDIEDETIWDPVENIEWDPQTGLYWDVDEDQIIYPETGEKWRSPEEPSMIEFIKAQLNP